MKKVALFGQFKHHFPKEHVSLLLKELEKHGTEVYIEQECLSYVKDNLNLNFSSFNTCNDLDSSFDFFISIGGDGTILRALNYIRDSGIPIIGVNAGRLGFLATVQKDEISTVFNEIKNNQYTISERNLIAIQAEVDIPGLEEGFNFALNEIAVSRKNTTSMISVKTYLNDEYLTSYWADGLIVSTATGSTGYSLSCGGPIITPNAGSFVLTPIAPHNLNMRPLVIPEDTTVKLVVDGREDFHLVSLDSRIITVKNGTELILKRAPFKIKMLSPNTSCFLKTLRNKMLWGEDRRN